MHASYSFTLIRFLNQNYCSAVIDLFLIHTTSYNFLTRTFISLIFPVIQDFHLQSTNDF